jgi:hypothetical protein
MHCTLDTWAFVPYRAGYGFGARALERYLVRAPVDTGPFDAETVLADFRARSRGKPLSGDARELAEEGLRDALAGRQPRL